MSSLASIARATGLAVTTVSEILRGKPGYNAATRAKVLETAQKLSYRPNSAARQLRGGRSGVMAALIGQDNPQANFDRLGALERIAHARGYRLMIGQIHHADEKLGDYLLDLASRGVDGVFWMNQPFASQDEEQIPAVGRFGGIVSLDHAVAPNAGCVRVDYGAGIEQAIEYLAEAGRKKIGIALAAEGVKGDPLHARLAGYKRGMKAQGLAVQDANIWIGSGTPSPTPEHLADILAKLVRAQKCDAILASNDIWAAELLRALRRAGLAAPKDVAIVGFDNLAFAGLCDPALTTIDQQHESFATAAVDAMEQILSGKGTPREVVVRPQLVVRESA